MKILPHRAALAATLAGKFPHGRVPVKHGQTVKEVFVGPAGAGERRL